MAAAAAALADRQQRRVGVLRDESGQPAVLLGGAAEAAAADAAVPVPTVGVAAVAAAAAPHVGRL